MKLVDDWRNWWRWHSMQALILLGAIAEWWLNSRDLQSILPPKWVAIVTPVVVAVVALLRLRKQIVGMPRVKPTVPPARVDDGTGPK